MKTMTKTALFYRHGFRSMQTGRTLWLIIDIKLITIFGFLKIIFFPGLLDSRLDADVQRTAYVTDNITKLSEKKRAGGNL